MIKIGRLITSNLAKLTINNLGFSQICNSSTRTTNYIISNTLLNNYNYLFSNEKKKIKAAPTQRRQRTALASKRRFIKKKTQKQQQYDVQAYSPVQYYRNIIRRINLKQTGRGRFNPIKFLKLISLCKTQEHGKLLFEAYYNMLGHFTIIPSYVVDELIIQAAVINADINSIIQLFNHHAYLGYFPHYTATNKVIKTIIKNNDESLFKKFLIVLTCSPLIKINDKIIQSLKNFSLRKETSQIVRQNIVKFLIYRRKLVKEFVSDSQLYAQIAEILEKTSISPMLAKTQINQHIQDMFLQPNITSEDLVNKCIIASSFNLIQNAGTGLVAFESEIGSQFQRYFTYLKNLYEKSDKQLNYPQILQNCLRESKVSIQNLKKLEQIKLMIGQQQTQAQVESK